MIRFTKSPKPPDINGSYSWTWKGMNHMNYFIKLKDPIPFSNRKDSYFNRTGLFSVPCISFKWQ